jgi:hypothetical protein
MERRDGPARRYPPSGAGFLRDLRGHVEPVAALVAVVAIGMGLTFYATTLDRSMAAYDGGRDLAEPTADRVRRAVTEGGVLSPADLSAGLDATPAGYRLWVGLDAGDRSWDVGPSPPPEARHTTRLVSVRVGPGNVRPGELEVAVWS